MPRLMHLFHLNTAVCEACFFRVRSVKTAALTILVALVHIDLYYFMSRSIGHSCELYHFREMPEGNGALLLKLY